MNRLFLFLTTLLATTTAVSVPSCQFLAPNQTTLSNVKSSFLQLDAQPFGLAFSKHNHSIAFVGLNHTLGVLSVENKTAQLLHTIPLPEAAYATNPIIGATGITITKDGKHVLVTLFSSDLVVVDAEKAIMGDDQDAVVKVLNGTGEAGKTGIEVTVHENFAFVSQEDGSNETDFRGTIEVFNLKSKRTIGFIELGRAVVGTALSKDEKYLYATSEVGRNQTLKTIGMSPVYGPIPGAEGTLSTLDVSKMIKNPKKSRISAVKAGCRAVRVEVSKDGKVAWVTARESNSLLAFSTEKLVWKHPDEALLASVPVGQSPVGHVLVKHGKRIVTADSNRWELTESSSGLSVVDVAMALKGKGKETVLGSVETGKFPREFALSPDGKVLLVSVFGSMQIQVVDVESLP